ncbi:MAG: DUF420 domain-containing protein [Sandaracinaceae bacterium]
MSTAVRRDPSDPRSHDRTFAIFNALLSTCALAFLAWLLLVHEGAGGALGEELAFLPALDAGLNATAAVLLAAGWLAIRSGKREVHKYLMVSAFVASALFLVTYVLHHYLHGDTHFTGVGAIRAVYFTILISHVLLSIAIVPMALTAFWLAYRKRFAVHKKVTRVLTPIWLYVSVTGVVLYFMLRA